VIWRRARISAHGKRRLSFDLPGDHTNHSQEGAAT
jgi:hypothetical protein